MDKFETPQMVGVTESEHLLVHSEHIIKYLFEIVNVCGCVCIRALQLLNESRKPEQDIANLSISLLLMAINTQDKIQKKKKEKNSENSMIPNGHDSVN